MVRTVFRGFAAFTAALFLVGASSRPAQAADDPSITTLEKKLDVLVGAITDVLKGKKVNKIEIGDVSCPTKKDDPHGSGLQREITIRLERKTVVVEAKASYKLHIEYGYQKKAGSTIEEVYIQTWLLRDGAPDEKFPKIDRISSDDMRDKFRLCSHGVSLEPDGTKESRDSQWQEAQAKPKVHLSGDYKTRVSSTAESSYYVELLAGPQNSDPAKFLERKAGVENGTALALIDKDEEYRIRIGNNSKFEAACRVYIDGLDMFDLSGDRQPNGDPMYRHILVPAGKQVIVPGWHRSAKGTVNWNAFVVTEFGKGVASRVNPKGPIGTIKVVFAESYDPNSEATKGRSASMETGRGRDLEGKQDAMIRKIENPRDCVVIHYTRGIEPKK